MLTPAPANSDVNNLGKRKAWVADLLFHPGDVFRLCSSIVGALKPSAIGGRCLRRTDSTCLTYRTWVPSPESRRLG